MLLALATSYYFNGYKSHGTVINSRETDKKYEELDNYNKIQLDLSIKDIAVLKNLVNNQLISLGAEKIHSDEQGSYALYIYQIDPQNVAAATEMISKAGTVAHKVEKINTLSSQVDLEKKLQDRQLMYKKEFDDYNNSKSKYSYQLNRINQIGKEIDSLQTQLDNQKNRAKTLVYVKATVSLGSKGKVHNYKKFFVDFGKFLAVFFFAALLVYYGTVFLSYILSLLGIKLPKLNSYGTGYSGYGGYSGYKGYGGYSYNEKNRKRKVKRIYRDKSSSNNSDEDNG
jgi:hypothetical protein